MDKLDILHRLVQVVRGKVPHLSEDEWDSMEESLAPGSTATPLSDADKATLATLQARADAEAAKAAAPAPANGAETS